MANDLLKGVTKAAAALFTLAVSTKIAQESQKNFTNFKVNNSNKINNK